MHPVASVIADELQRHADPAKAEHSARYFQAGPGGYGEGDQFLGITVPQVRSVCKAHRDAAPIDALDELLRSDWHEHRLAALILLGDAYERAERQERAAAKRDDTAGIQAAAYLREEVYDLYLSRTAHVDNWDLVDTSAARIVGPHLDVVGTAILDELAASSLLWERRIAMIAPFHRIRRGEADTALAIARELLADPEPLIHKAVGWMLREIGKRVDEAVLLGFLDDHARGMPAVMLSYATERLTPEQRATYRALRTQNLGVPRGPGVRSRACRSRTSVAPTVGARSTMPSRPPTPS